MDRVTPYYQSHAGCCRQLSHGAGTWLGLAENEQTDTSSDIWFQRRVAFHGGSLLMGRGVSKKCKDKMEVAEDQAPTPTPRDPYHIRGIRIHSLAVPNR